MAWAEDEGLQTQRSSVEGVHRASLLHELEIYGLEGFTLPIRPAGNEGGTKTVPWERSIPLHFDKSDTILPVEVQRVGL